VVEFAAEIDDPHVASLGGAPLGPARRLLSI